MDDWKPGDLALCVATEPWKQVSGWPHDGPVPECGCIYTVESVWFWGNTQCLCLHEFPDTGYGAKKFRKVRPVAEEAESTAQRILEHPNPGRDIVREPGRVE